jgi:signal transduction histidine kinase
MHLVVSQKFTEPQWVQINSIPEYDESGQLIGSFGIWRNIQKLMNKQEQLKSETERANDSGHQKSVFLANMTHEIRTPLNAIVGFSDLLQAMEQPEEKRELIRIIHNNCDMLLRLINDILVLSSVDSTGLELIPERIDFSKEFDIICQSLAQRIEEPTVEFQKENPLPSLVITIDNARIQQVITNFVTNAVKNTHQGHIRVGYQVEERGFALPQSTLQRTRNEEKNLYVYCEDTGAGIPEEEQTRIFERFVKLNDFVQGTGLGLSICKAIIEKCGGEIGVNSEVGKGSTFWFRIPIEVISEE